MLPRGEIDRPKQHRALALRKKNDDLLWSHSPWNVAKMRYFFLLLLLGLAVIGLMWYLRRHDDERSERLKGLLDTLERRYDQFMKQRLTLAYIKDDDWQAAREQLIAEALEILKPTLDALAAQVSGSAFATRELRLDSDIFHNVSATAEALAQQRGLPRSQARQELYGAFGDAMRADLANRWLQYQTGDRLSPQ